MNRDTRQVSLSAILDAKDASFDEHLLNADCMVAEGNFAIARATLSEILNPDHEYISSVDERVEAHFLMGKSYTFDQNRDQYEEAEDSFRTAWKLSKESEEYDLRLDVIRHYCACLMHLEKYDDAKSILTEELNSELLSNSPQLLAQLASISITQNDFNGDEDALDYLLQIKPEDFIFDGELFMMNDPYLPSPLVMLLTLDPMVLQISYQGDYINLLHRILLIDWDDENVILRHDLLAREALSSCIMNNAEVAEKLYFEALESHKINEDPELLLSVYLGISLSKALQGSSSEEIKRYVDKAEILINSEDETDIPAPLHPRSYMRRLRAKCAQNPDFPPDKLEGAISRVLEFAVS